MMKMERIKAQNYYVKIINIKSMQKPIHFLPRTDYAICEEWDCTNRAVAFEDIASEDQENDKRYFCQLHCSSSLPCSVNYQVETNK
jgi:hypothetical protein